MSGRNIRLAKGLRRNMTDAERLLWKHLRAHRFQHFKFRRQQPIGPFIVDFVCFELRLVIELDGGQHSEQEKEDGSRTAFLNGEGFRVIRFWNDQVLKETESVLEAILSCLPTERDG